MPVCREQYTNNIHQTLADTSIHEKSKTPFSLYRLQHACYHQVMVQDHEAIWSTLHNPQYLHQQISYSNDYAWSTASIKYGLAQYVSRKGAIFPEDDARLAWLVLRGGELVQEAVAGVDIAFAWFVEDTNLLEKSLQRIEVLSDENYYKACLRLLLIEAWRQQEWPVASRDIGVPQRILESVGQRILEGTDSMNWWFFLADVSMIWWMTLMWKTWEKLDLGVIERRTDPHIFVKQLIGVIHNLHTQGLHTKVNELLTRTISISKTIPYDFWKSEATVNIANALVRLENLDTAVSFVETSMDDQEREKAYCSMGQILAQKGTIEKAIEFSNQIWDGDLRSLVLVDIANALFKEGNTSNIIDIIEQITDSQLQSRAYCDLAYGYFTIHDFVQTDKMLEKAIFIAENIAYIDTKTKAYHAIANIYAQIGNVEKALEFTRKITKDSLIYTVYSNIAKVFFGTGDIQKSLDIIEQITDSQSQSHAYCDLAYGYFTIHDSIHTDKMLEKAISIAENIPYIDTKTKAYFLIIETYLQIGQVEKAIEMVERMSDEKARSQGYCHIAQKLLDLGENDRSNHFLATSFSVEQTVDRFWQCDACLEIATTLVTLGRIDHANIMLQKTFSLADTISNDSWKFSVYLAITRVLVDIDDVESALEIIEMIPFDYIKIAGYVGVFKTLMKQGDLAKAEQILDMALCLTETLDEWRKPEVYVTIAQGYIEIGDVANGFLARALDITEKYIYTWKQSRIFADIAIKFVKFGNVEKAYAITNIWTDAQETAKVYIAIAKYCAKQGDMEKALATITMTTDAFIQTQIYVQIIQAILKSGREEAVDSLLDTVVKTIEKIEDNQYQIQAYCHLSKLFAKRRQMEKAHPILHKAHSILDTITDDQDQSAVCIALAKAFIHIGELECVDSIVEKALTIAERLPYDSQQCHVYLAISKMCAKQGNVDKAISTALLIKDGDYRSGRGNLRAKACLAIMKIFLRQNTLGTVNWVEMQPFLGSKFYEAFVSLYQEMLLDTQHLRQSYLLAPFTPGIATTSVLHTINHHLRQGNEQMVHAIIRMCPQVDVSFVLPETM